MPGTDGKEREMVNPREKAGIAIEIARPAIERIAKDEDLRENLRTAFESAARIYAGSADGASTRTVAAARAVSDPELQDEMKKVLAELRKAGNRARGKSESHRGRNGALIAAGLLVGLLFNPLTGPDTRRWIKDQLFGAEEPFEYSPNGESQPA
jgi:hypothetical protein